MAQEVLGYTVLQVIPSMRGTASTLGKELDGPLTIAGRNSGRNAGSAIAKGITDAKAEVQRASAELALARAKEADAADKVGAAEDRLKDSRDKQANAAGNLRSAEARLQELRDSGTAKTSALVRAEEAVEAARRKTTATGRTVTTAEKAISTAREQSTSATRDATAAAKALDDAQKGGNNRRGIDFGSGIRDAINFGAAITGVSKALGVVGAAGAGISAVGAGIGVLGGAAGAAAGAVGVLGAGLASLAAPGLAAVGTVAVGLMGIKDAFKAVTAADQSAGADATARAQAVSSAQKQVETAERGVTTAERTLTEAKKSGEDAEKDLTQARKDATQQLESYNLRLADAQLSEVEATESLRDAQKDLATAGPDPDERAKALTRVQRAELTLAQTQERNKNLQAEAADAQAKGVEGADGVVAAKGKIADANQRISDAETGLADAHRNVADAQAAVTAAANTSSAAQTKAAQAMAQLSPKAQAFVSAAMAAKPAWDDLQNSVQDRLFDGAAQQLQALATNALPTLKTGMVDVAGAVNGLTHQFGDFWQQSKNLAGVQAIFSGAATGINALAPGLQQATGGVLSLAQAFAPLAGTIGSAIGGLLGNIGTLFTSAFNSGALTQLAGNFASVITGLSQGLQPLIAGLIQAGNIVGPVLGPLFAQLGTTIGGILPPLAQLGQILISSLVSSGALPALTQLVTALANGLQPVLPIVANLLAALLPALQPLVAPLSQITQVIGTALTQAITALAPAVGPLGTAIAALVTAFAPLIPVVAQVTAGIVQALAPALTTVFGALAPLITQWANLVMPVFQQLQPVLAQVAQEIGTALAGALQEIVPVLPSLAQSFGGLIIAIAPLLPQLVQMAASLLPPLVSVLVQLTPVITKIMDALTWLAKNVIVPVLIPALTQMTDTFKAQIDVTTTALSVAKDTIGASITAMVNLWHGMGDSVKSVWDGVVRVIAIAVKAIGGLLQKVPSVHIPGTNIDVGGGISGIGDSMVAWAGAHGAATGGVATASGIARAVGGGQLIQGPGTGTSDSILAMIDGRKPLAVSSGEFVSTEQAYKNGAPLLWALNQGWVPPPALVAALVGNMPRMAAGGVVPGEAFAQSMDSAQYQMGGFSTTAIDCSGMVAATINSAMGRDPFSSRMSTVTEGDWLTARGALPGLGGPGDIAVAWYDRGGGANGHTVLRLGDGTGVESRGDDGVVIGSGATPVTDPMFDQHMHIPRSALLGGDLGGPAGGLGGALGGGAAGGGLGGSGGSGTGGGTAGASAGGYSTTRPAGNAVPVWVDNWPQSLGGAASSTATPNITTTPGTAVAPTITPAGGPTEPATQQALAVQAALSTAQKSFGDAGKTALDGQLGALPGGSTITGGINHWNVVVKDVDDWFRLWQQEQQRQAMAAGSRF